MIERASLFVVCILALFPIISPPDTFAQSLNSLKAGVVRIQNSRFTDESGAGFIVGIAGGNVYIITAAHVVKGSQTHRVYLYSQQHESLSAEVLDRQEDGNKGLALLLLKTNKQTVSTLTTIELALTSGLGNGESVKLIGFPGTTIWTVDNGSIKRLQGSDLVLSGAVREGNSGGPVIINQQAVGLVTDVVGPDSFATRAELIVLYINGIVPDLIGDRKSVTAESNNGTSNDGFCQTLHKLLNASRNNFVSIKGPPLNADEFDATIKLPGATLGKVIPPNNVNFRMLTDTNKEKVERQFYSFVPRVRSCLPQWEEKEDSDTSYRFQKFRKEVGGVVVSVYYNPVAQRGNYFLILDIAIPSARRREW